MDKYGKHESRCLRDTVGERRSVAALAITMAVVFIACFFVIAPATPMLPPDVLHALASLPSFSDAPPAGSWQGG